MAHRALKSAATKDRLPVSPEENLCLEANSLPGMTRTKSVSSGAQAAGIPFPSSVSASRACSEQQGCIGGIKTNAPKGHVGEQMGRSDVRFDSMGTATARRQPARVSRSETLFTNPDYSNAFAFSPRPPGITRDLVTYMFCTQDLHLVLNMLISLLRPSSKTGWAAARSSSSFSSVVSAGGVVVHSQGNWLPGGTDHRRVGRSLGGRCLRLVLA